MLHALRCNDFVKIEDALGVPGGPNSGLTARLMYQFTWRFEEAMAGAAR